MTFSKFPPELPLLDRATRKNPDLYLVGCVYFGFHSRKLLLLSDKVVIALYKKPRKGTSSNLAWVWGISVEEDTLMQM